MVRDQFISVVSLALRERCGVAPGHRLVVAVSGGADSVALLRTLHTLAVQPHWALDLHVAHVNHQVRSDAAIDEAFAAELARSLGLRWHRRELSPQAGEGNLEANLRHGRYAALAEIAAEVDADAVAVAHHADDQLETVLMRSIRGASVQGLSGMWPRRRLARCRAMLIRPMLQVDREQIVAFLHQIGQGWREDSTNADVSRWRAHLRSRVLPVLRQLRPSASIKASESADRLRQVAKWIDRRTCGAITKHVSTDGAGATMSRLAARRLDAEIVGSVLRRVARRLGASADALSARVIRSMTDAARDGSGQTRRFDLAGGVRITIDRETVRWARYDPAR